MHRRFHHQGLVAGTGVHQARGDLSTKGVVQTGLVAANADVDLIGFSRCRFVHKVRVGQKRARHGDHVRHAVGKHLFGHLGRVDAVGGDEWNTHLAFDLLGDPGKGGARNLGGNRRHTRLVPADASVQNRDTGGLQRLGKLHHLVQGRAPFNQIEHGQAEDQDEIGAYAGTGAPHNFQWKTDTVCVASTPGIVAVVGVGGDELVDQIAFGAHDLHAVVASALRQRCRAHEIFNGLLHLFRCQRMGAKGVDRRLDGAGGHQFRMVGIAAEVQDLHANFSACRMHRISYHLVLIGLLLGGHARATGHGAGAVIGRNAACHHQRNTSSGALRVKSSHALKAIFGFFQAHMHGAHEHTVLKGGKAQIEGAQHQRIG